MVTPSEAVEIQRAKIEALTEQIGRLMTRRADAEDRLAKLIQRARDAEAFEATGKQVLP